MTLKAEKERGPLFSITPSENDKNIVTDFLNRSGVYYSEWRKLGLDAISQLEKSEGDSVYLILAELS